MNRRLHAVLAGAALAGTVPAAIAPAAPAVAEARPVEGNQRELAADRAALAQLQADDTRLQSLGWRLAAANAPYCGDAAPSIGLLVQDMDAFADPQRMRRAAGISGDFMVEAVAAGSPAQAAGLLPGDELMAIGGIDLSALPWDEKARWRRGVALRDAIGAALARSRALDIAWRGKDGQAHRASVTGTPICPVTWELRPQGKQALSDGPRVVIGRDHPAWAYGDAELAAMMAHELAHVVLHHRAWLDAHGHRQRNVRLTEREADRLMPWILANAGFDPQAAVRFMRQWGPPHDGGLLRKRDHAGWDERVEFIEAELPLVRAAMAQGGKADWAKLFRRETRPRGRAQTAQSSE